jgi:ATP-dependent Clp protease ATP-binding subunit ClpA
LSTDIEILRKAREREDDPRRPKQWRSWEFHAVGATREDVRRLLDQGYVSIAVREDRLTKYLLTEKGRSLSWPDAMERKFKAIPASAIMEALDMVIGFNDIKETLADILSTHRRVNVLMEGPPACAKSLLADGIRQAVPGAYMAFGSRTSAAGLSEVLFEQKPTVLLLDELDKCRHDVYSVLLGLMEKGEILETKSRNVRGIVLDTIVIAACNSSAKLSPEILSRFSFHPHFPEYSHQEFLDVVVGMLTRMEGCAPELALMIGTRVYDMGLGDVRKARGVWQLMREPTEEEVKRVIRMNIKYGPQNDIRRPKRALQGSRLPGM